MRRLRRAVLFAVILVLAAACDEKDCLRESATLAIGRDDAVEIRSVVEVQIVGEEKEHARLLDRAYRLREELANQRDAWSMRFALLNASEDSVAFRRSQGKLVSVQRTARVKRRDLPAFFADTGLSFYFFEGDGWSELVISPSESRRAPPRERDRVHASLGRFASVYAAYAASTAAFYDYMDGHPERIGAIRKMLLDEKEAETLEIEDKLVDEFTTALDAFGAFQKVDESEELSLEAAAMLVYDPFPADLVIELPGAIEELDGFERSGANSVRVRRSGLVDAVRFIDSRWVSPAVLPTVIGPEIDEAALEALIDRMTTGPRKVTRPSAAEVRQAIEEQLRPRKSYRVRWENPAPQPEAPR